MTTPTAAEVLNDLIQINSERISRYEHSIKLLLAADQELRFLFARVIGESHHNKITLATELQAMGEMIDLSYRKPGAVYQFTIQNMPGFGAETRLSILDNTEASELAVLRGYDLSLEAEDVAAYLRDVLTAQQCRIKESYNEIKTLKDQMA